MEVIQGEKRREKGYGGLYNVGKAATKDPPALVVLTKRFQSEHDNDDEAEAVTLVGKGIVYDTGGLSLKISGGMVRMKTDCGGAAGVLAAFEAAVHLAGSDTVSTLTCIRAP